MNTARKVPPWINVIILIWKPPIKVPNHFLGNKVLNKIQGQEYYKKVTYHSISDYPENNAKIWGETGALLAKRTKFWSRT